MMIKTTLIALGSFAALSQASAIRRAPANTSEASNSGSGSGASSCLDQNAIQTGSFVTGQVNDVAADGQSNSNTDKANFINFCSGQTLTNGLQIKTGSCNGIVMGKIPATTNMVSTVITSPKLNDQLAEKKTFNVTLTVANMNLGSFTNATNTYYSAPQDLAGNGDIIGHTHVTIQDVGSSFQFTSPLDATRFVFFKGINDAGNGQGTLTTAVTGGLPAGNYRICTMSSSSNHQPVLMPVAQRGAQDDCRYFSVSSGNGGGGRGNDSGSESTNNAASGSDSDSAASSSASVSSATSSAASSTDSSSAASSTDSTSAVSSTDSSSAASSTDSSSAASSTDTSAVSSTDSSSAASSTDSTSATSYDSSYDSSYGSSSTTSKKGTGSWAHAVDNAAAPPDTDSSNRCSHYGANRNPHVKRSVAI